MEIENVRFMLDSIQILLECGETDHALELIEAFRAELDEKPTKTPAGA